ncbi:hypothetical protein [Bacteroides caecimuris]|uniref:hypothetical protein n=1 Tax=Bacteroides caecimuris TaxID=1796613 RepID=UPI0025B77CBA|nr:hypothetical protein [Bacteroides caecimuris]
MKQIFPILYVIFLMINIVAGLILSCYPMFNMGINTVVICVAALFSYWVNKGSFKSAFTTSLAFIIPLFTLIEFIMGLLMPSQLEDNWGIIAILCLMAFNGCLIYAIAKRSANQVKNKPSQDCKSS